MRKIPSDRGIDSTAALIFEGYHFISNRCERLQSDIFQTRLLLQKTICFRGKAAATIFYDTDKFMRQNAAPKRAKETLLGAGGVQGLDGGAHRHRKQAFMALMTPEHIAQLIAQIRQEWEAAAQRWEQCNQVVLLDAAHDVLCRAVCAWAGVPLPESEVAHHTQELAAMIDGSGGIGPRHWKGKQGRKQAEAWIETIIDQIRAQTLDVPESSAAHTFAWYRNPDGQLLDRHAAAVELLNVLRPTVAIARYIAFAALALHEHPECKEKLNTEPDYAHLFTQEVRRFYPFFPFAAARTCKAFDWQDYHFPKGVRVMLDLYGTNHDPDLWESPNEFRPERFRHWDGSPFNFIPQGGGDFYTNHRCAGEWITIQTLEMTLDFLTKSIQYDVPSQDLEVSYSRMPTMPQSGFVMSNVKFHRQL